MDWFKVYSKGWLQGSIRQQLTVEQRSVWIDLIALASETKFRDGTLRHGLDVPMPREYIASVLQIPLELLNATIEVCQHDRNFKDGKHRIEIWDDGTIELANFADYQSLPEHIRKTKEL